jgi:cytochrome c-type biogenesis protein CcmE
VTLIPDPSTTQKEKPRFRVNKFIVGGGILLIAVVLLVITSIKGNAQYYLTVDELLSNSTGRQTNVRVSGVVLVDTIEYDTSNLVLTFSVANIPGDNKEIEALGGLAQVLHAAVLNPDLSRMKVEYHGVKPDLLKNEAQAIMTGSLGSDGVFHAEELLLKCPSRYEEAVPLQAQPEG